MPWTPAAGIRLALAAIGIFYITLGISFFANAGNAAQFWIDARGITPLTVKLFSSPLVGLGLGMVLVSRAGDWRMVAVLATGMITIGLVVFVALVLSRADFAPTTWIGWLVAATPIILFSAGAAILVSKPATRSMASRTAPA